MTKIKTRETTLTQEQVATWFTAHLPYLRVSLTNHLRLVEDPSLFGTMTESERHRVRVCTYEVGVLTCRKFIEFLGLTIKYNPYELIERRDYYPAKEDGKSYEVKVVDLGGKWVELPKLTPTEKDILQKVYLTGHRATVHLTDGSPYQGEWHIFHDAVKLVDRLLKENLYDVVGITPTLQ
jgi:hypothetical protein